MKNKDLYQLFIEELKDMHNSENQILEALPKMIKHASSSELKEALSKHLKETENQVKRLDKIFSILGLASSDETCEAMEGILKEGEKIVSDKHHSPVLDATIICACQKVEHYEIASYGTLKSLAKTLDLDSKVSSLIQENLDEEGAADKKLTKIAEGSLFTTGVNKAAAKA